MAIDPVLNADFLTFPGDTVIPTFTVVDGDGAPVDISSATAIAWIVRASTAESATLATLTLAGGQIAKVNGGTGGQFTVTIGPTVTTGLNGAYQHLAQLTFPSGIVTAIVGRMMVNPANDWSYNAALMETVPLYFVRRLLGDVIPDDRQIWDSELLAFLSYRAGNVFKAAADAARALAAQYSRKVDTTSPGPIQTSYGEQAKKYFDLATEMDQQAKQSGKGIMGFAGGISIAQKVATQQNPDRVQPAFNIGFTDNIMVPVAQIGVEAPTIPMANTVAGA